MQLENFQIDHFKPEDYPEYKTWFSDPRIRFALGGVDLEWLEFVQQDKTGQEFSIRQNGTLLAVVGVVFPTVAKSAYVISNIAVNPNYKQKGIGSKALTLVRNEFVLKEKEYWLAYVERENLVAQTFFEKNHWEKIKDVGEGLVAYQFFKK